MINNKSHREYFYPYWLRIWHWANALLFAVLILSGVSLHYSASNDLFIPFDLSIMLHNYSGIGLSTLYIIFFIMNIISGNYKQYIPKMKFFLSELVSQAKYYVVGIFRNAPHPFEIDKANKFNPLQRITYLVVMYFFLPTVIFTGWLLFFPELAPENIAGMGGFWPMAVLHSASGFFLSLFMVGHIYLATTGEKLTSNFKAMIDGWHISESRIDDIKRRSDTTSENTITQTNILE